MTEGLAGGLAAVRDLWRRDRPLIAPLSLLFFFLPQYAVLLLVPPMPTAGAEVSVEAWGQALEPWVASYGGWYVVATLLSQYGALAVVSLYMPPVPTAAGALGRALRLFPRALLAGLLVTMPCGMAALLALSVPLLPLLVLPAIVYVLGRVLLANPVILAERGTGAVAALVRSWRLTSGRGLPIALLVGAVMIGGQALGAAVIAVERGFRGDALANPVLLATIDAVAAGVTWAAGLALALVQVVLYRRLEK